MASSRKRGQITIIEGDIVEKNSYQCCFCNQPIISGVTELNAVVNWDKDKSSQQEKQMFCHVEWLEMAVSSKFPLYIADLVEE